jgi:hypothetical protein
MIYSSSVLREAAAVVFEVAQYCTTCCSLPTLDRQQTHVVPRLKTEAGWEDSLMKAGVIAIAKVDRQTPGMHECRLLDYCRREYTSAIRRVGWRRKAGASCF